MSSWETSKYSDVEFTETDDPRIVAFIERDTDPHAPDGDAQAPAYDLDGIVRGHVHQRGTTFADDESARLLAHAMSNSMNSIRVARRYMSVFFDATFLITGNIVVLNTPSFREHVGLRPDQSSTSLIEGEAEEWRAYLDGDCWLIGYAVNENRVTFEAPLPAWEDFEAEGWSVDIKCGGFFNEEYAKGEAATMMYAPSLAPMIW